MSKDANVKPAKKHFFRFKPDQVLLEFSGETLKDLPAVLDLSARLSPRSSIVILPKEAIFRLEMAGELPCTIEKMALLLDYLVDRNYLMNHNAAPAIGGPGFTVNQKFLQRGARKRGVRPLPNIGPALQFLVDHDVLRSRLSKSKKRRSYRASGEGKSGKAMTYWFNSAMFGGPWVCVRIGYKGKNAEPTPKQVLIDLASVNEPARINLMNIDGTSCDMENLKLFLDQEWKKAPLAVLHTTRKLLKLLLGHWAYHIAPQGRHYHDLAGLQRGIRGFVEFKGFPGKVELDLKNSAYTILIGLVFKPLVEWHKEIDVNMAKSIPVPPILLRLLETNTDLSAENRQHLVSLLTRISSFVRQGMKRGMPLEDEAYSFLRLMHSHPRGIYGAVHAEHAYLAYEKVKEAIISYASAPCFDPKKSRPEGPGQVMKRIPWFMDSYFRTTFPNIDAFLLNLKHKMVVGNSLRLDEYSPDSHKRLTHLVHALESAVILHLLLPLLRNDGIPVFSVHDGVELPAAFADRASVITNRLFSTLGIEGLFTIKPIDKFTPHPFTSGLDHEINTDHHRDDWTI
jgi:hypothetical protein